MGTKLRLARIPKLAYGGSTFYDTKPVKTLQDQQNEYNHNLERDNKDAAVGTGVLHSTAGALASTGNPYLAGAAATYETGVQLDTMISNKDEYGVASGKGEQSDATAAVGSITNSHATQLDSINKIKQGKWGRAALDIFAPFAGAFYNNQDKRTARDEEIKRQQDLTDKQRDLSKLSNYPIFGNMDVSYNEMGGKIPVYDGGGKLLAIGSGAKEVVGAKHEEGGVNLLRGGKPIANVEDEEVLYGDKVYSNRVQYKDGKSFADAAKTMAAVGDKNGLEKLFALQEAVKPKETSPRKEMTYAANGVRDRNLIGPFDNELNTANSTDEQAILDSNSGMINKKALAHYGYSPSFGSKPDVSGNPSFAPTIDANGNPVAYNPNYAKEFTSAPKEQPDYLNNAAMAAPFISAGVNAIINNNRPKIPTARMEEAPNLSTTYDINPALANVKRNQLASNVSIDQNTANSADARNAKLFASSNAVNQSNTLYNEKTNQEVGLKNAKAVSDTNTANRNLAKLDTADAMRFAATVEKQNAFSENVAHTSTEFQEQVKDNNQRKLDQQKVQLTSQALSIDNPAGLRQGISNPYFRKSWESAGRLPELKEKMSTEQASVDEWNREYPNDPTILGWKRNGNKNSTIK
jgi:hypothetical protein